MADSSEREHRASSNTLNTPHHYPLELNVFELKEETVFKHQCNYTSEFNYLTTKCAFMYSKPLVSAAENKNTQRCSFILNYISFKYQLCFSSFF